MYLQKLSLLGFKNYKQAELSFSKQINCFVGNNGEGKTNLLDAIHYLSFCKSFFNPIDSQNIHRESPFMVVQGLYIDNTNVEELYCGLKRNEKKQFKRNKKEYNRFADHIGLFPLVMISPSDSELVTEGSESRRKFMDMIIVQYHKEYLEWLIQYNRVLAQRNATLKQFSQQHTFDKETLEIWDIQLIELGNKIYNIRKKFIEQFVPLVQHYYSFISGGKEEVKLNYVSQLNEDSLENLMTSAIEKDRILQYTSTGIHKDDLSFEMNGFTVKKFASQGQQKSYLVALRIAQFDYIKNIKNKTPLLLLDDICDKLDENRVKQLMHLVSANHFGQIFITDTHEDRIATILNTIGINYKLFMIKEGVVEEKIPTPAV